jgi:uncharacterized membrane protein YcaP (DUF421 family)
VPFLEKILCALLIYGFLMVALRLAAVLFAINFAMAVLLFRSVRWHKVIQGSATVLIDDGVVDKKALRHEKLCEEDLLAAVECQGATDFGEVSKAILEPNGTIVTLLKTPNYETQHFLALSKQIEELREALDHGSWMATVANPKPDIVHQVSKTAGAGPGDHGN